jgi:membrane associated rhomboid family serine protease
MSAHSPIDPFTPEEEQLLVPASVRRRRAQALRVRRRRLLVADVGLGALLALIGLVTAPGLAVLGIASLLVLVGCAISLAYGPLRRRARRRRAAARARS